MAKKKSKKTTAARATKKTAVKARAGGKVTKKKATTAKAAASTRTRSKAPTAAKKTQKTKSTAKAPARSTRTTKRTATTAVSSNGHARSAGGASGNGSVHAPFDHGVRRQLTDADLRAIKSGLSRKDLNHFRAVLLEKRAEIFGDVQGMQEARNSANGGDISHMPLHMADVGSDNYEQEFTLGLMESERRTIVEIDEALTRIQNGTYGVCIESGQPIPRARLEIKPWAKYTIEVARERERRGLL